MALELPNQYDPKNGGAPDMRGAFDNADIIRRAKMEQDIDAQQAFFRQQSGDAENTGEMSTNGNASFMATLEAAEKERDKSNRDKTDLQMLLAVQELNNFENDLVSQYGENFDLDLLGELVEDGHFTDEDYAKFASIEDPEERRRAIAQAFQDKIDAGEIDPQDYKDHPFAIEWLEKHEAVRQHIEMKSDRVLEGKDAVADASRSVQSEAKTEVVDKVKSIEIQSASMEAENNTAVSHDNDIIKNSNSGLSGLSL